MTHINGLVQDCSNSIATTLELLQSCTKSSNYMHQQTKLSFGENNGLKPVWCQTIIWINASLLLNGTTVNPKKYAHGFVVLCFVVVMQSFIMNSHEVFIHIHQGCFAGTGAIVRLPQCQWSKPDGYGKISQCITTTKHSKAKTVCIFLGIYCMGLNISEIWIKIKQFPSKKWKCHPQNGIHFVLALMS